MPLFILVGSGNPLEIAAYMLVQWIEFGFVSEHSEYGHYFARVMTDFVVYQFYAKTFFCCL